MAKISLWACSFHLTKLNELKTKAIGYDLNNGPFVFQPPKGKKKSRLKPLNSYEEVFLRFCKKYSKTPVVDAEGQTIFSIDHSKTTVYDLGNYCGILYHVNAGDFGNPSKIVNVKTNKTTHDRTADEADVKSFLCYTVIPKTDDKNAFVTKGMMFFAMIGKMGVKTLTTKYLRDYLSNGFGISIHISTIAPSVFMKKLFASGQLHSLQLYKNIRTNDNADPLGYGKEKRTLSGFSHPKNVTDKITSWVVTKNDIFEFKNEQFNNVSVVIDIDGRQRTIDIFNVDKLSVVEILPDEVLQADGNFDIPQLLSEYNASAAEYLKYLSFAKKK